MTPKQARALGAFIRQQREQLGLSARELARRAGVADVIRLEQGSLLNPRSSTLNAVADALEVPVADLFAVADWLPADELPSFRPYLRAKYHDLPEPAVAEMDAFLSRLRKRHGLSGPIAQEDER
jgi:transcriptional regulator with XRE-family HTH domain